MASELHLDTDSLQKHLQSLCLVKQDYTVYREEVRYVMSLLNQDNAINGEGLIENQATVLAYVDEMITQITQLVEIMEEGVRRLEDHLE